MKDPDLETIEAAARREHFSKRHKEWGLVLQLVREYRSLVADSATLTEYVAANAPELTTEPPRVEKHLRLVKT